MADEKAASGGPLICEGDILCGRYRAERVLEHGGTGTVLVVTDMVRDEPAAIKMISADHGDGELLLARLRREADILARLTSPHVVRVLDVAMHGQTLCLVMELLRGLNMARFVRRRGPLPIPEAVGYIVQACDGLADAHGAGVVHRDVKPQNVFLADRRDGTAIVKVLDFGVARQYSVSGGSGLTVGGELLGSPPYSAPEQLRDPSGVDGRADIWSIGLVLYFLLTRRNAFDADTFPALLVKIATQPPPPLRAQRPDVPEELEAVFLRCVEKEPAARFPDMASLARALAPFAPSWSSSFVQAIDFRLDGRGSLASLPVIPLGPDLQEDTPSVLILPEKPEPPPPSRPAQGGATGEGPVSRPANKGTTEEGPVSRPAPGGAVEEAPVSGPAPRGVSGEAPVSRSVHNAAQDEAPVSRPVHNAARDEAPVSRSVHNAARDEAPVSRPVRGGVAEEAPVSRPAGERPAKDAAAAAPVVRSRRALEWLAVVGVAILAPAVVGLVLFLVVQFGGCSSP